MYIKVTLPFWRARPHTRLRRPPNMPIQHIWPDSALYPLDVHRSMRMLLHTELPSLKLQSAQSRTSHTGRQWGAKQVQSTLLLPIATSSTAAAVGMRGSGWRGRGTP